MAWPAIRAARLVTGPEAVKVQRAPVLEASLVAPTQAAPLLIPMWRNAGWNTPANSSFSSSTRRRMAKALRVAFSAWSAGERSLYG